MAGRTGSTKSRTIRRALGGTLASLLLVATACGDDDEAGGGSGVDPDQAVAAAEQAVAEAQAELATATEQFCADAEAYVEAIDRYGKVFTDDAATVGDVTAAGSDLVGPRQQAESAAEEVTDANEDLLAAEERLVEARARLASSSDDTTAPSEATATEPLVPPDAVDRVVQAEEELSEAAEGITDDTPVAEATASFNSAAVALEVAWMALLDDAGCFSDEERAETATLVRDHTTAVQTALTATGYYSEAVDGIYGPSTVAAVEQLQADNGLPTTGYVDRATAEVLASELEAIEEATGDEIAAAVAAVQTILRLAGTWDGPIDGVWSEELSEALRAYQVELGVEPTGVLDAATVAAFQAAVADATTTTTTTTSTSTSTTTTSEPDADGDSDSSSTSTT